MQSPSLSSLREGGVGFQSSLVVFTRVVFEKALHGNRRRRLPEIHKAEIVHHSRKSEAVAGPERIVLQCRRHRGGTPLSAGQKAQYCYIRSITRLTDRSCSSSSERESLVRQEARATAALRTKIGE